MNLADKNTLCSLMSFVYRTMVASVPLLKFAVPRCQGSLRLYYTKHVVEEHGHAEMLFNDLQNLGVYDIPHSHLAAQFAGSQYYLIAHEHPALLLGYMRALESESLPEAQVDGLSAHHGVTLTAMKHHAIHDPQHKKDLDEMIAGLDEGMRERVLWNESNIRGLMVRIDNGDR